MPRSASEYDLKTYTAPTFDLGWLMDPFNNQAFLRSNYERNQPSRWNSQEYLPLALVSFTLETTESLV
jgi:hypothetical protein